MIWLRYMYINVPTQLYTADNVGYGLCFNMTHSPVKAHVQVQHVNINYIHWQSMTWTKHYNFVFILYLFLYLIYIFYLFSDIHCGLFSLTNCISFYVFKPLFKAYHTHFQSDKLWDNTYLPVEKNANYDMQNSIDQMITKRIKFTK